MELKKLNFKHASRIKKNMLTKKILEHTQRKNTLGEIKLRKSKCHIIPSNKRFQMISFKTIKYVSYSGW